MIVGHPESRFPKPLGGGGFGTTTATLERDGESWRVEGLTRRPTARDVVTAAVQAHESSGHAEMAAERERWRASATIHWRGLLLTERRKVPVADEGWRPQANINGGCRS